MAAAQGATPSAGQRDPAFRVREYLAAHGLDGDIIEFACSTRSAEEAAQAVGCELGQVVKSLVVVAGEPVLVLVAGDRRADFAAIAQAMGVRRARMADVDTVTSATGYEVGGVSPFDLPDGLVVLVDDSLTRFDQVFAAAGTACSMVRMASDALVHLTSGRVARISH